MSLALQGGVLLLALLSSASAMPNSARSSHMMKYSACRDLVATEGKTFAISREGIENYLSVCNCSWTERMPGLRGIAIVCKSVKEAVIDIPNSQRDIFNRVLHYILKYRIRGTQEWTEKRIEKSADHQVRIDLDLGERGRVNVYEVIILAVLPGETREIYNSSLLASTGREITGNPFSYNQQRHTPNDRRYSGEFKMAFRDITQTSMDIVFNTNNPDIFRVYYMDNGRRLRLNLDQHGRATLRGLTPSTDYIFIVMVNTKGTWEEMSRKTVTTSRENVLEKPLHVGSYGASRTHNNALLGDVTIVCPYNTDDNIQTITWYKGENQQNAQLLATYDTSSRFTTYPANADPRMSIANGHTLKLARPTVADQGRYLCRVSILGTGPVWQTASQGRARIFLTWNPRRDEISDQYWIKYRLSNYGSGWQNITIPYSLTPSVVIRDLEPYSEYSIQIYPITDGVLGDLIQSLTKTSELMIEDDYRNTYEPTYNTNGQKVTSGCDSFRCSRGVCHEEPTPNCVCNSGFTGDHCDQAINNCDPNPCSNGDCYSRPTGPICNCWQGYEGNMCQRTTDPCRIQPCRYGTCKTRGQDYFCQCRRGYTGKNCDQRADNCNPNPCRNGGDCRNNRCSCRRGFSGRRCETDNRVNFCDARPCIHGTCNAIEYGYTCQCNYGYRGRNCDIVDDTSAMTLICPTKETQYGEPLLVLWYKNDNGISEEIFRYDYSDGIGRERGLQQFEGRLSSPASSKLRISDVGESDKGLYKCVVSYAEYRSSPLDMNVVFIPEDTRSVTVLWDDSPYNVHHYDVGVRDVTRDIRFRMYEVPASTTRYTFNSLLPGGLYEVRVTPFTKSGVDNDPVELTIVFPNKPTPTEDSSRSDSNIDPYYGYNPLDTGNDDEQEPAQEEQEEEPIEKTTEKLDVKVYGPPRPIQTGNEVFLACDYLSMANSSPRITWKKIKGGSSEFIYNQKMPPNPIRPNTKSKISRISMTNVNTLRIGDFKPSDAGIYECTVVFETETTIKNGSGTAELRSSEGIKVEAPTDFRFEVLNPSTTEIRWRQPEPQGITGYVVRYWPTVGPYGVYETRRTTTRYLTLTNLAESNEYNVEIMATDGSVYSKPLTRAFFQEVEPIPAPTDFRMTVLSESQARIDWEQPEPEGITGYKVKYWDVSLPEENNLKEVNTTDHQVILSELIDGREYQVMVQAGKNDKFSSPLTSQFRKHTPISPDPPTNLQIRNVQTNQVTLHWDAPSNWRTTDKYRVKVVSQNPQFPKSHIYRDSAPKTKIANNLKPGVRYRFSIYTVRDGMLSRPLIKDVNTVSRIEVDFFPPNPLNLTCNAIISGVPYRTRWYKVAPNGDEDLIFISVSTSAKTEYAPYYKAKQYTGRLSADSLQSLSIYEMKYPDDYGTYKCVVASNSGTSEDFVEVVRAPISVSAPIHFAIDMNNDTSVLVSWNHTDAHMIDSYIVRYWPTIRRFGDEKNLETPNLFATLTDLIKGTEYQVEIKAKVHETVSDDSLRGQFIKFADPARNVQVRRLNDEELEISWENPLDIDGTQISVRRPDTQRWNDQPPMAPHVTSRRIRMPLEIGETVEFMVSTLKNNIPSPNVITYTEQKPKPVVHINVENREPAILYPDRNPHVEIIGVSNPTSPTNLVLESTESTTLHAGWEPTDLFYDTYNVMLTELNSNTYENFTIQDSNVVITDLIPYGSYEVSVRTVHNGAYSEPVVGRIQLGIPAATTTIEPMEQIPIEYEPKPVPTDGDTGREPEKVAVLEREVSSEAPSPTNMRFSKVQRTRMTVTWVSPSEDILDFEVKYRPAGFTTRWISIDVTGNTVDLPRLRQDTRYEVQVSSYVNENLKSLPLIGSQKTIGGSLRRPSVRVTSKTENSFMLEWIPQDARHSVSVIPLNGAGQQQVIDVPKNETQVIVNGLDSGRKHRVIVTAISDRGRKSRPSYIYVTTNPIRPEDLQVTAVTSDSISLRWRGPPSTLTTGFRLTYYPDRSRILEEKDVTESRADLTELQPDTYYTIRVQTKQGSESSEENTITARTTEETVASPTNIQSLVSGDDLVITWNPVEDAEYYSIEFYPEDDPYNPITRRVDSPTSYVTFPNVRPGNYVIKISASKSNLDSPQTEVVKAMPIAPPSNIQTSNVSHDGFTVSWEPSQSTLYTPFYDVIAMPNAVHAPEELSPSQKRTYDTSFTIDRLRPNYEYKVQVIARYGDMKSEPIQEIVTTEPLSKPSNVRLAATRSGLKVSWEPVVGVDYYEITYNPVDDPSNRLTQRVHPPTTFIYIRDSAPGGYEVNVTSVKNGNKSPASVRKQDLGVAPPLDIRFTDITPNGFVTVWTPPRTRQRVDYEVSYRPANDRLSDFETEITRNNFFSYENLLPGTEYLVEVVTVFGDRRSVPVSGRVETKIPEPQNLNWTILYETDEPVEIAWQDAPYPHSTYQYEVSYNPVGESPENEVILRLGPDQHSAVLRDLLPGTEYIVKVYTVINDKLGTPEHIFINTPLETPKNPISQPLSGYDRSNAGTLNITWDGTNNAPEYEINYYTVNREGDEIIYGEPESITVTGGQRGVILRELLPATEYIIEVTAVDGRKTSRPGKFVITTPLDQPSNVHVFDLGQDKITLTWQPSDGDVDEYEFRFTPNDDSPIITQPVRGDERVVTVTGLKPDTVYEVTIVAKNREKNIESLPLIQTLQTKPRITKPMNVEWRKERDGSYTFLWDQPEYAVQYYRIIYAKTSGDPTHDEYPVEGYSTETRLPLLIPNEEYTITIQAITDGVKEPSEYDSVSQYIRTDVPGLTNLYTYAVSDESIRAEWERPSQERFLTEYFVQLFVDGDDTPIKTLYSPTSSNIVTFEDLKPSTNYTVKVQGLIGDIPGSSATGSIRTDPIHVVPAPGNVHVPEYASEDFVVSWDVPRHYEFITNYDVIVADEDGKQVFNQRFPGDTYTVTVSDLQPGKTYDISVTSLIDDRSSEESSIRATTLPEMPTSITSINVMPNQFEIFWSPSGGEVNSYLIKVVPKNNPYATEHYYETTGPETSILIPDVEPGTTYTVEIIAIGSDGSESRPAVTEVTTGSPTAQPLPEEVEPELSITVRPSDTDMVIKWQRQNIDVLTSYQILYKHQDDEQPQIITVPAGVGQIIMSSLQPNEPYDIWVRAILDTGERLAIPITADETVTELSPDEYSPLTDEPVTAPGDGRVSIIWEDLGPDITTYGISYRPVGSDEPEKQVIVPGDYSGTILSSLVPDTPYHISVTAIRATGEPVRVPNVNIGKYPQMPDETSMTTSTTSGQLTIHWVPDRQAESESEIIGYKVIYDRKCCLGEPEWAVVPGSNSDSATIGYLEPDTDYVIRVVAMTNESLTIPVTSVEKVDETEFPEMTVSRRMVPPTITDLEPDGYTVTVYWDAPKDQIFTHYTIQYIPLDNEYSPTFKLTLPKTERSHTITGLYSDTLYKIAVQTTDFPSRTSSEPATETYRTPIDSPSYIPGQEEEDFDYRHVYIPPIREVPSERPPTDVAPVEATPGEDTTEENNVHVVTTLRYEWPRSTTSAVPNPLRSTDMPRTPSYPVIAPVEGGSTTITLAPTDGQATIAWEREPFVSDKPEDTVVFRVTYIPTDEPDNRREVILPSSESQVTLVGLNPETTYAVEVDAVSDYDSQIYPVPVTETENVLTGTLKEYRWIFQPNIRNVERLDDTGETINVQWLNPTEQRTTVTHYVLEVKPKYPDETSSNTRIEIPAPHSSHVVTGLQPDQDYIITLQSVNAAAKTRSKTETTEYSPRGENTPASTEVPTRHTIKPQPTSLPIVQMTEENIFPTHHVQPTPSMKTPVILHPRTTPQPGPIKGPDKEPSEPDTGEEIEEPWRPTDNTVVTDEEDEPGIEVLPTLDGNILLNWTPVQNPLDSYRVEYREMSGDGNIETVTVPSDKSWINLPEPSKGGGYVIRIYTDQPGNTPQPIYHVNLERPVGDKNGYNLVYRPLSVTTIEGVPTITQTETTSREIYIPALDERLNLPDDQYLLQVPRGSDEYINWFRPRGVPEKRPGRPETITLRWQPDQTRTNTTVNRYRLELVPINDQNAERISVYAPANSPYNIRGLQPGVSYRLYANNGDDDGLHRAGEIATNFVIPAFSRYGKPLSQRRFGISEVWIRELKSGGLLLQWEHLPGATEYYVEYEMSPGDVLYNKTVDINSRWMVLPALAPGATYTLNIFARMNGNSYRSQIYTVTIKRKITGPAPPPKVWWYNMYGDSVDLAWLPPRTKITGFRLTYQLEGADDSPVHVVNLPVNVTKYHLSNLTPGETYTITIQSAGDLGLSRPLTFPLQMTIPTVRKLYFQQNPSDGTILIRWPKLPNYVTGYLVQVRNLALGRDLIPLHFLLPDQTNFTVTSVQPGWRYEFSIRTLIGEDQSEPVTLQLWTLPSERRVQRFEQGGSWTVSWNGNPDEVDHWKIIVTQHDTGNIVLENDNINRFVTRYNLTQLTPGSSYNVHIYGVKNDVDSTPINIVIPANPTDLISHRQRIMTQRQGTQIIRRLMVKREPDQIEISIYPHGRIDSYEVKYKKNTDSLYRTTGRNFFSNSLNSIPKALITDLEPGSSYNITIIAYRGQKSSELSINVQTQQRRFSKAPLHPITRIERLVDNRPGAKGFYLRWQPPPRVPVSHYIVQYNYTDLGHRTQTVTKPEVYVPNVPEGYTSADYKISYVTTDDRKGPTARVKLSFSKPRYYNRFGPP